MGTSSLLRSCRGMISLRAAAWWPLATQPAYGLGDMGAPTERKHIMAAAPFFTVERTQTKTVSDYAEDTLRSFWLNDETW